MFVALGVLAPTAGAVLVKVGPKQVAGVMPVRGVSPASIPGSYAKHRPTAAKPFAVNGNLDYNGGIVLHGEAPYLIFWDPTGQISALDKALYERFFADGAHDSGLATNVYAVDRQFTDSTGFADYSQTWDPSHAITDIQPYPTTGQCTEHSFSGETACLFDSQIRTEIARLISANGLPTGETGNAPIYFVVTPPTVNSCMSDNSTCADNFFCAYHSGFADGSSTVLYANMATILDANDPKGCQVDHNSAVQEPNSRPIADVNIKAMSHEFNETITDPNGNAWWHSSSAPGNEDGDNCNFYGSTVNPNGSSNPNAFTPVLGGDATSGTLFNQVMNGNDYYTQSEWSNGNVNCEMKPPAAILSAAFTASPAMPGSPVTFDPTSSSSSVGYTSTTWNWGDGASSFSRSAPTSISHTYAAAGTYTATLTTVDTYGNLSTVSHPVSVAAPPAPPAPPAPSAPPASPRAVGHPTAVITAGSATPTAGQPYSFSGAQSSDVGSSISSYRWSFGDGGTGTAQSLNHAYARAGLFTVTLTVTDATGSTASTTTIVSVQSPKIASISIKKSKTVERITLTLSGPGTLSVGKKKFSIKHAGGFVFTLRLSKAQRNRLHQHHTVNIKLTFKFKPTLGSSSSKTVSFPVKG